MQGYYQRARKAVHTFYAGAKEKLRRLWQQSEPWRARVIAAGMGLYASFSTFRSTLELAPVIFSGLTILAAAPLLSYFLPAIMFDTTLLFILLATISGLVGYSKYKEIELRKQLDNQIDKNTRKIEAQHREIEALTLRIQALEGQPSNSIIVSGYNLRRTQARQQAHQSTASAPVTRVHAELNLRQNHR